MWISTYNGDMAEISPEIEAEIQRRVEQGHYGSADELLRLALKALDDSADAASDWLEGELLKGLEGDDVEVGPAQFARLRAPYDRRISERDAE